MDDMSDSDMSDTIRVAVPTTEVDMTSPVDVSSTSDEEMAGAATPSAPAAEEPSLNDGGDYDDIAMDDSGATSVSSPRNDSATDVVAPMEKKTVAESTAVRTADVGILNDSEKHDKKHDDQEPNKRDDVGLVSRPPPIGMQTPIAERHAMNRDGSGSNSQSKPNHLGHEIECHRPPLLPHPHGAFTHTQLPHVPTMARSHEIPQGSAIVPMAAPPLMMKCSAPGVDQRQLYPLELRGPGPAGYPQHIHPVPYAHHPGGPPHAMMGNIPRPPYAGGFPGLGRAPSASGNLGTRPPHGMPSFSHGYPSSSAVPQTMAPPHLPLQRSMTPQASSSQGFNNGNPGNAVPTSMPPPGWLRVHKPGGGPKRPRSSAATRGKRANPVVKSPMISQHPHLAIPPGHPPYAVLPVITGAGGPMMMHPSLQNGGGGGYSMPPQGVQLNSGMPFVDSPNGNSYLPRQMHSSVPVAGWPQGSVPFGGSMAGPPNAVIPSGGINNRQKDSSASGPSAGTSNSQATPNTTPPAPVRMNNGLPIPPTSTQPAQHHLSDISSPLRNATLADGIATVPSPTPAIKATICPSLLMKNPPSVPKPVHNSPGASEIHPTPTPPDSNPQNIPQSSNSSPRPSEQQQQPNMPWRGKCFCPVCNDHRAHQKSFKDYQGTFSTIFKQLPHPSIESTQRAFTETYRQVHHDNAMIHLAVLDAHHKDLCDDKLAFHYNMLLVTCDRQMWDRKIKYRMEGGVEGAMGDLSRLMEPVRNNLKEHREALLAGERGVLRVGDNGGHPEIVCYRDWMASRGQMVLPPQQQQQQTRQDSEGRPPPNLDLSKQAKTPKRKHSLPKKKELQLASSPDESGSSTRAEPSNSPPRTRLPPHSDNTTPARRVHWAPSAPSQNPPQPPPRRPYDKTKSMRKSLQDFIDKRRCQDGEIGERLFTMEQTELRTQLRLNALKGLDVRYTRHDRIPRAALLALSVFPEDSSSNHGDRMNIDGEENEEDVEGMLSIDDLFKSELFGQLGSCEAGEGLFTGR